jgi:hypothetical protein
MSQSPSGRFRRITWQAALALAMVLAVPLTVVAAHTFDDVPDSNEFHGSITWMHDNGITVGCNPPDNTLFCPSDGVTREQMASFMRRFAQTQGSAGANVNDTGSNVATNGTAMVELLTVEASPKAEAAVTLNAHVTLEKATSANGTYQVVVARDSCAGTVLGAASWLGAVNTEATSEASTIAVTATDVATGATTYVLCAAETVDASPAATASTRGLTASWVPTS